MARLRFVIRFFRTAGILLVCCLPASAASANAAKPETGVRHIKIGTLDRHYVLHVPSTLPKDRTVPLVLMFHGGGGTPGHAERETGFSRLADREGFLVAYPQGHNKSWNDGRASASIAAQRDQVDDVGFVAALIEDVARIYQVDEKRIFATGISNGATFSHFLAARLSRRIAAIAPVAGGIAQPLSQDFRPEDPVSVLIMQGTADPLVPYHGGEIRLPWGTTRGAIIATESSVRLWSEHNGAQSTALPRTWPDTDPADGCRITQSSHAGGRGGTAVILYRLEGAGHTWPGGTQYLPKGVIGGVCRDINATAEIWRFFKAHPKP